ncbi:TIGR03943 family putative permease subunit [Gardnerella sp. 2492-Sm]|uniref:TIGR03943 family putative permease subunit n=1 Tax=unclassified Gardnerella TaxID=2628112 RepID=UPI003D0207AB
MVENSHKWPKFADYVSALCLFCFSLSLAISAFSGSYTVLTTPRAYLYLLLASFLLLVLSICAAFGIFNFSAKDSFRIFVALVVPTLLIVIPLSNAQNSRSLDGFDQYSGGRAIAIRKEVGVHKLRGLDEKNRTIRISDDDFGLWYDEIDHNQKKYLGYRIIVNGFVSRNNTLGVSQFRISRQFMSCCILDMSPFGFVVESSQKTRLNEHKWISLVATVSKGNIGIPGYQHYGSVLKLVSVSEVKKIPTGYFYRP